MFKTTWIKLKRKKSIRYERSRGSGKWKTSNYCFVRKGDSIIITTRLESFWSQFYSNKTKKNILGDYIISKDKMDNDEMIKYCYVYLTGRVKLLVKKLYIKKFNLVKVEEEELKNRYITNHWYNFQFNKQNDIKRLLKQGLYGDIYINDSKEIEKQTKKLNNKDFTKLFLKVSQTQKIGRQRLRRKTTHSTYKRQGINTIKYNLLKEWGLLKYVDELSMVRLFKVSKTNKVIGRNYLVKR